MTENNIIFFQKPKREDKGSLKGPKKQNIIKQTKDTKECSREYKNSENCAIFRNNNGRNKEESVCFNNFTNNGVSVTWFCCSCHVAYGFCYKVYGWW